MLRVYKITRGTDTSPVRTVRHWAAENAEQACALDEIRAGEGTYTEPAPIRKVELLCDLDNPPGGEK